MRINILDNLTHFKQDQLFEKSSLLKNKNQISENNTQRLQQSEALAKEFETLYLDMMIKSMRQTAKSENESNAHDIFQSMLDGEYSKLMASAQSFGIRDFILNWIKENDPALNLNLTKKIQNNFYAKNLKEEKK
jgi:flagellar protein FlgJ